MSKRLVGGIIGCKAKTSSWYFLSRFLDGNCLDVGACLKVNTRALGRGALHKKGDSIPLLLTSDQHTGRGNRRPFTRSVLTIQYPNHIYTQPLLVHDSAASKTEYPKHPPCSVRDAISETLRDCQVKTAIIPVPADHLKVKISQSSIIYHFFHQSIQTFISLPVPMLLSKHKVQSIQNTQQTVIRYQPFRYNCSKTTQNADPLSSSFSQIKRIK